MHQNIRPDNDLPQCVAEWGWKYHHLGVPTTQIRNNEKYIPQVKAYVSGFSTSPFGIEWMRWEEDSPVHQLIKTIPHLTFEVKNLDLELKKHNFSIIFPPSSPSNGVRAAMIEWDGAPIELIEFE